MTRQDWDPLEKTGRGRSKLRPPPRPATDSLPVIECPVQDCGHEATTAKHDGHYVATPVTQSPTSSAVEFTQAWFCSWGCLGRFAARMELRA